ncbi:molybdopterin-guanine dinucleotide biosynthesis protein A [Microbacterium natoriense]|uniref:Molybdopterin-guanine dinucleotide biosynthesis protein A n=1 Tax=Microbacterium natoriense TaxID=284570 RepID=A0AAW8EZ47_9MICO|nr:NTP transferase domain-containing protein [Microbacterium natoriense]MDQ0648079.1 molybdopterin-guanine dinucleotide biosynthesis protein A [Microbacterium natoriense]
MTADHGIAGPAIVLAGGRARRLGGADKPMVPVAGRPLIEHAIEAAATRQRIVVVGGPFEIDDDRVVWAREEPRFGGPAAALAAGLDALGHVDTVDSHESDAEVLVLAADLPEAVRLVQLLDAAAFPADVDGVVGSDAAGREQWLAGRYHLASLRRAVHALAEADGASMRDLLSGLVLRAVPVGGAATDLDTWEAIDEYRRAHPANSGKDHIMTDSPSDLETWVRATATDLGLDPDQVPTGLLLDVTRETAHEVVRPAGPVTTFLIGLAVGRGSTIDDAVATVRARIAEWPGGS